MNATHDADERVGATGSAQAAVLWEGEPGACGGRLDPDQHLVPDWLAERVDWHVRPSASPWATAGMARTVCEHVDWTMVWVTEPELFSRRAQIGSPAPPDIWQVKSLLAEWGMALQVEVQFEEIGGQLALGIYGAGVAGRLPDQVWGAVAPLLSTCCSTIREPRADVQPDPVAPARPASPGGRRPIPSMVIPQARWTGDWHHTWWSYPMAGPLRARCTCSAHWSATPFGPSAPRLRLPDDVPPMGPAVAPKQGHGDRP